MTPEMPKAYDPRQAEPRWYAFWEAGGYFQASDDPGDTREPYTIAIPPFNVTGSLHMGHACRVTFEDVLTRYHRMLGRNTLWLPGTDHAGIATQLVVERQLARAGTTRHQLGREAFVERVWAWKAESGGRIMQQLRVLGASCDWSREKFTLDADLAAAVTESFVQLYREGLIYRDTRLISWCVQCDTALSDLEVENEEGAAFELFDFAYPIEGGGEIVVSTTRPETMLGDTAIAVHPDDPRYQALIGKNARHPFVDRLVPIIADPELVDMNFGSGAVKVTPAHDPNDFATGKRHGLPAVNILHRDGTLNENAGPFAGLPRFKARKAVMLELEKLGLLRGQRAYSGTKPHCHRCNSIIEPLISTQWFCKMEPLARPAVTAVEQGKTRILPEHWTKTFYHWMNNIQDWCISRQLWWGHAIPAYYCECGEIIVERERPAACSKCGGSELRPDPDVLDTWFSSALWPFSTLGWPRDTADLRRFYPTSDMETGSDILFFWVARMMMMGLHFLGEVPFGRVLLSGMVTDEHGQKMSKVKGNVIDPLDVVHGTTLERLLANAEQSGAGKGGLDYLRKNFPEGFPAYGADALRFTLLSYSPQTVKIALSLKRVEGYRNFCNKLWNAARYALMNMGEGGTWQAGRPAAKRFENRWILSRLANATELARTGIDQYRLDEAGAALYRFVWNELCDWYLELSKPLLVSTDADCAEETRATLRHVLETALRLLHPMLPFITEEIWQRLPKPTDAPSSIMITPYPETGRDGLRAPDVEQEMGRLQAVIVAARTIRSEHDLPPRRELPLTLRTDDPAVLANLERDRTAISTLCNARLTIELGGPGISNAAETEAAVSVVEGVSLRVPLAELVDPQKERERLQRELKKLDKDLTSVERKLQNQDFLARAPGALVEQERARQRELGQTKAQLEAALERLG
jgi:valyl-tRNA synthetase